MYGRLNISHAERGYLHARTNVPGSDDLNGINVKYQL
ncbi:Ail/Lom family outer membrane beta-barrel protein [Escherichia coli]